MFPGPAAPARLSGTVVAAMVVALGCGGGGAVRTCGDTTACGGDVVGTWKVTSSCQTEQVSVFPLTCDASPAAVETVTTEGTVTYNADLSYTLTGSFVGAVAQTYPESCLVMDGQSVSCEQLNQRLGDSANGACKSGHTGCTCRSQLPRLATNEAGTYATTATGLLTRTPAGGGSSSDYDYCVTGGTLAMSPHVSPIVTVEETLSGTITFAKQ